MICYCNTFLEFDPMTGQRVKNGLGIDDYVQFHDLHLPSKLAYMNDIIFANRNTQSWIELTVKPNPMTRST